MQTNFDGQTLEGKKLPFNERLNLKTPTSSSTSSARYSAGTFTFIDKENNLTKEKITKKKPVNKAVSYNKSKTKLSNLNSSTIQNNNNNNKKAKIDFEKKKKLNTFDRSLEKIDEVDEETQFDYNFFNLKNINLKSPLKDDDETEDVDHLCFSLNSFQFEKKVEKRITNNTFDKEKSNCGNLNLMLDAKTTVKTDQTKNMFTPKNEFFDTKNVGLDLEVNKERVENLQLLKQNDYNLNEDLIFSKFGLLNLKDSSPIVEKPKTKSIADLKKNLNLLYFQDVCKSSPQKIKLLSDRKNKRNRNEFECNILR
ncbi:hypothetical protein HK099_002559, partial [Clydaea vesicula]